MNLFIYLITGLTAGWFASIVLRTQSGKGFLVDTLLGVIGALLGGFLMSFFTYSRSVNFDPFNVAFAIYIGIFFIFIGRKIQPE